MKYVIDIETKKKFRLVNLDFRNGKAVIHNKQYGYCTQDIDKLRSSFLHFKLTQPTSIRKKFKIIVVLSVAYSLVWIFQVLGYAIAHPDVEKAPAWLTLQIIILTLVWVVIGIIAAIKWRNEIWEEIKSFINQ